jgi:hypothetical protein
MLIIFSLLNESSFKYLLLRQLKSKQSPIKHTLRLLASSSGTHHLYVFDRQGLTFTVRRGLITDIGSEKASNKVNLQASDNIFHYIYPYGDFHLQIRKPTLVREGLFEHLQYTMRIRELPNRVNQDFQPDPCHFGIEVSDETAVEQDIRPLEQWRGQYLALFVAEMNPPLQNRPTLLFSQIRPSQLIMSRRFSVTVLRGVALFEMEGQR